MTQRGEEWNAFSKRVLEHVENYAVVQYGDAGEYEGETPWTAEFCIQNIMKYCRRFGQNQRNGQEVLDLMKIAHYAQMAALKIENP